MQRQRTHEEISVTDFIAIGYILEMKQKSKSKSFAQVSKKPIPSSVEKSSTDKSIRATQDIDTILKSRWQGAINIRGIRFQIFEKLFGEHSGEDSSVCFDFQIFLFFKLFDIF